jgi:hypothetical protein
VWFGIRDQLERNPAFSSVKIENTANLTRERETSFEIDFIYDPDKAIRVRAGN